MDFKRVNKAIEAINTYYAFAVLLYVAALYVASHSQLFWWVLLALTPLFAGWTGFLFKSYLARRNQRYGFRVLSDKLTYELKGNHRSALRYATEVRAEVDHLFTYPIGYQWTGKGEEHIPEVLGEGQQLLGTIRLDGKHEKLRAGPYREVIPSEGEWHFWLVGLRSPLFKGEKSEIKYVQEFTDSRLTAKPCLYYFVRSSMESLQLNVKFPENALPKQVTCSYTKLSDTRRKYAAKGVVYEPEKQWASWTIRRPKRNYCYRIEWQ
jgi:hypothetical protein